MATIQQTRRPVTTDAAVISTNDCAFLTKISSMQAGYFVDKYLDTMCHKYDDLTGDLDGIPTQTEGHTRKYQPVMNRATYGRVLIKDRIITDWINHCTTNCPQKSLQIVSLGAGYDTSAFRLLQNSQLVNNCNLSVFEIDLDPVVHSKCILADQLFSEASDLFKSVTKSLTHHKRPLMSCRTKDDKHQYKLISCDLRNMDEIEHIFTTFVDRNTPTFIICEMCLVYLQAKQSDSIIQYLSRTLQSSFNIFFNLEPLVNNTSFGRQMEQNIAARGSTLLGLQTYPTIDSQKQRFINCGWSACVASSMSIFWKSFVNTTEQLALQRIEQLDELEELNLLLDHYCIIVAAPGSSDSPYSPSSTAKGRPTFEQQLRLKLER